MYEITAFVDEKGEISSFMEARYVKIFKNDGGWKEKKIIILDRTNSEGIKELREKYINLIKELDDCKIVVVNKAFGIPFSVFYTEDFSVWELEGNPINFLDKIIDSEKEQEELESKKEEIGKKIKSGYYFIDLLELEITNPEMTSKKAIIPYLENGEVEKVEIKCCHVPPWLIMKRDKGEIGLEINEIKRNEYNVIIEKCK